jgi:hypothetical protein
MAMSEERTRAPRGTKTLTQAFFSALAEIPEERRDAVARAAQSAIREELQARRMKKSARGGRTGTRGTAAKTNGRRKRATPARGGRRPRRTAAEESPVE